jgi:integrase
MSDRIKLTPGRVEVAKCPDGKHQVILRDSEQPGLGLRVTAGSKSYIFQGKLAGQVIRMTMGDVQTLTLSEARDRAAELRAHIRSGRDPRIVKAEQTAADSAKRRAAQMANTPALEVWEEYLKARAAKWSARTLLDHERLFSAGGKPKTRGRRKGEGDKTQPGPLYDLLQKPLVQIDRAVVGEWLQGERHRPTVARGAFVRLRAFLNWCSENAKYASQSHADACGTTLLRAELPKARARDDCLQREQLRPWFESVATLPNRVHSAYLQCLLLTGARRNELTGLQWLDVDFQWDSITIRDKVEGERIIPLTPYVKALLLSLRPAPISALPRAKAPAPSPWVFVSDRSKQGHITEPRLSHNRALGAAGLPSLTLHGLRRSFATLAEWTEAPTGVVAQIMGHKPSAIAEKHYRRRPLDLLRSWHTQIEGWILREAGIEQPKAEAGKLANVVA